MRIYILNILPQTLKNKLDNLIKIFGLPNEKIKHEIYSNEYGIHILEDKIIYHIENSFNETIEKYSYNDLNLLVDKTNYTKIPVISQLPTHYIDTKLHELTFKTDKKSRLSLIIECLEELENYEKLLVPMNYYFEYNEPILDLTDIFFEEEFNRFLSGLN
jgi:hypothetical protein